MNKQIVLLTMFVVLINSCAPNALPNVTATSEATATSTFTPAPTATSTVVPTPTNTPDPSMPKGTLGNDASGNYVDVQENGRTVRYYETTLTDNNGEARYHGWVGSHVVESPDNINGGMPLQDPTDGSSVRLFL